LRAFENRRKYAADAPNDFTASVSRGEPLE